MSFVTAGTIIDKVKVDLDLEAENFVSASELLAYLNEGIKAVENQILRLSQDYFLDFTTASLVASTATIDLPSDIFADKVRKIVYNNGGGKIYTLSRMRFKDDFEEAEWLNQNGASSDNLYRWRVLNDLTAGRKIYLYPTPNESGSFLKVYYLRNARQCTATSDTVDIPEFYAVLEQFIKVRCYEKEGNPLLQHAKQMLDAYMNEMTSTLAARFADEEDTIEMDTSHYEEHI